MRKLQKCPVCSKPLTVEEYDKALGLWKEKQEHIKHLEAERKRLREQERLYQQKAREQAADHKRQLATTQAASKKALAEQERKWAQLLNAQKARLEKSFNERMRKEVETRVAKGVAQQKKDYQKQETELRKTRNKMLQLESSLMLSADKYERANEEIKRLKEQIAKGTTPQIDGLLEEKNLLAKLRELFPKDRYEHTGKGGDIIQTVMEQGKPIGKIVYECKRVKNFDRKHIEQAKKARRARQADFAVLVTNAFPAKKQFYFVDKDVLVISPISLDCVTHTLRESLKRIAVLKIESAAKEEAVQRIYDYLSSQEYNNKVNDISGQLNELGRELKMEIVSHKRTWIKRYSIYRDLFNDVSAIDYHLKDIVLHRLNGKSKLLLEPARSFIEIRELEK
jgi:hypothetical protein